MNDTELIITIRSIRRLVATLDSIGFPIKSLVLDPDVNEMIPDGLHKRIVSVSTDMHGVLQTVEKSKIYKDAIKRICNVKERD
ncbi:hypothetical protein KAR91_13130 [Candidatus Pacearchaeota archaeon]|nr:hypothetical protein [Candidatus Pacearchaeota archaeon]